MTFQEQLWLTTLDKGLLALIAGIVGFYLNRFLEKFRAGLTQQGDTFRAELNKRSDEYKAELTRRGEEYKAEVSKQIEEFRSVLGRQSDRERLLAQKHLDYLERQLTEFYYPLYIGLYVDSAVWDTILARNKDDPLRKAIGERIEKDVLLPNHDRMLSVIQSKIHLADADADSFALMLKYVRHASIYKAMRSAGCFDKDPYHLGEPFPKEFISRIESTTDKLQNKYDALVEPALTGNAVRHN
jgi:hypothetical protein